MFIHTNAKVISVICLIAALLVLAGSCGSQPGMSKTAASTHTISGIVYFDANVNATYDSGDALLSGQVIAVINNTITPRVILCSAVTNADGYYEMSVDESVTGQLMNAVMKKGDDYLPPFVYIDGGISQDLVQNFRIEVLPSQ